MTKVFASARIWSLWAVLFPVLIASWFALNFVKADLYYFLESFGCFFVGSLLQILTNIVNDYYDSYTGVDKVDLSEYKFAYKISIIVLIVLICISGFSLVWFSYLAILFKVILLFFGLISILAAYFYTGSKYSYAKYGLGEFSSFFHFGIVATFGTYIILVSDLSKISTVDWITLTLKAVTIGLAVCLMMQINNLNDIESDKEANKWTLAVHFGRSRYTLIVRQIIVLAVALAMLAVCFSATFYSSFDVQPLNFLFCLSLMLRLTLLLGLTHFNLKSLSKKKYAGMGANAYFALGLTLFII